MIKQTAGRDSLKNFAPEFAHFNDDVLFGENWNNNDIDLKTRCIITVVSLLSQGICDSSLKYHIENAKRNGVSQKEMAAIITHVAFYAGWPKAWAAFNLAKEVYKEESEEVHGGFFGLGKKNDGFAKYFIGQSYLNPLTDTSKTIGVFNVTFEPRCRNNWHVHKATKGGGQILICVDGSGWYQEEGKGAISLNVGDVITIPANVKHWHGAKKDSWFSHIAIEVPGENTENQWFEPVLDEQYDNLETR